MFTKNLRLFFILMVCLLGLILVQSKIPRHIWTYWNSEIITSPVVLGCIESWRQYNPTYTIHVLGPKEAIRLLGFDVGMKMNDGPTRESDIVRANILQKYGGVWLDSSILLKAPLYFPGWYDFYGYNLKSFISKPGIPVIENWCFATVPHGQFITEWKNEFMKAETFDSYKDALEDMKTQGVMFDRIDNPNYLYMHVCAQKILQKNPSILRNMYFYIAEDTAYLYLTQNNWDVKKGLESICKGTVSPLIKFRGGERKYLEEHLDLFKCIQRM